MSEGSAAKTAESKQEKAAAEFSAADARELKKAAGLIKKASAVIFAAGAGLSVPSGIDYNDPVGFKQRYPGIAAMGFRCCYEMIGQPLETEYKWGYGAVHANWMMTHGAGDKTYADLKQLAGDKPYFVMTSNADGMFGRNGFAADRIYTPQGSYTLMQCMSPTCKHVYDSRPIVAKLLAATNLTTTALTDKSLAPVCPKCGGAVYFNLNGGSWYINTHWEPQRKKFMDFLDEQKDGRVVIIEVGAGFNTPGVIRWPMESLSARNANIDIVRVNLDHPEFDERYGAVPPERGANLGLDSASAITGLLAEVVKK